MKNEILRKTIKQSFFPMEGCRSAAPHKGQKSCSLSF